MTYCFVCWVCKFRWESRFNESSPMCPKCGSEARRDYRTEGVGVGSGVRVSRDGLIADQARDFLPTNEEMAGPGDPDGTTGIREWREQHAPQDDNTKPYWPGTVERKVY